MFLLRKPDNDKVRDFLATQQGLALSYPDVGITKDGDTPEGWHVHHRHAIVGRGEDAFEAAAQGLRRWGMFEVEGVCLFWPETDPEIGTVVGVATSAFGIWSLNACRVLYTIDDTQGDLRRFGFGYGTLASHVMRGEERFLVEWDRSTGAVRYDLLAFSKAGGVLISAIMPIVRRFQWRFGTGSLLAMERIAGGAE